MRERTSGPSPTWRAEPTPTSALLQSPPVTPSRLDPARLATAREQLKRLEVRGWDRTADLKRSQFGKAWSDDVNVEFGHNGCNTRDDILRRDLNNLVVRPRTCYAQTGTLVDPYTGETIAFTRGPDTSNAVEIDHVVALADAWYKGARSWYPQRRLDFANDPRNLLAVSPKANFNKAFRDAASWIPPQRGVPVRLRRAPDRGQDRLRTVGGREGAQSHGGGTGALLSPRVAAGHDSVAEWTHRRSPSSPVPVAVPAAVSPTHSGRQAGGCI